MRLLFIGGTRFVGAAMAREALARGHEVELFHRSDAVPAGLEGAKSLKGDRNSDLTALASGRWDAVIDCCAYRPREVHAMLDAIGDRASQYVFVSTVSVYDDGIPHGSAEHAPRKPTTALDEETLAGDAVTPENYGPLKVLCEDAVFARRPDALVMRPTYVIGPGDYTNRFSEWVRRIAAGGEVIAPGPREAAVQYIDARDLADFTIGCIEGCMCGVFHVSAAPPGFGFAHLLDGIAEGVAPDGTTLAWIKPEEALESGREFPLWHGGESAGIAAVDPSAAIAHGLRCRPLAQSARDVLASLMSPTPRRLAGE